MTGVQTCALPILRTRLSIQICELNRALFLSFMTKPTEPRDDYYAQMKSSSSSEEAAPKPKILKIKTRRPEDGTPSPTNVREEKIVVPQSETHKKETPKPSLSEHQKPDTPKSLTLDEILAQKNKMKAPRGS